MILDDFVDDPRVRDLIREQSLGLLWDALEVLRRWSRARLTTSPRRILRKLLLRGPCDRRVSRPTSCRQRRDRSHAGIVARSVGSRHRPGPHLPARGPGAGHRGRAARRGRRPHPQGRRSPSSPSVSRCSDRSTSRSRGGRRGAASAVPSPDTPSSAKATSPSASGRALVRGADVVLPRAAVGGRHARHRVPPAPPFVGRPPGGLADAVPRPPRAVDHPRPVRVALSASGSAAPHRLQEWKLGRGERGHASTFGARSGLSIAPGSAQAR